MIVEETHVTCDKCQKTVCRVLPVLWRISAGTEKYIRRLTANGWLFVRDDKHEITVVICPECKEPQP